MSRNSEKLHARARAIRARAAIRRWELGQQNHASGVWFRVMRLFALSSSAWAISDRDSAALVASGHHPDPAGLELQPPRRIFIVTRREVEALRDARPMELRASIDLLRPANLALVPFGDGSHG